MMACSPVKCRGQCGVYVGQQVTIPITTHSDTAAYKHTSKYKYRTRITMYKLLQIGIVSNSLPTMEQRHRTSVTDNGEYL